jgi:chromosome segregation ATPase
MKHGVILAILCLALDGRLWAETAGDQFLRVYKLIEQADILREAGQPQPSLDRYRQAEAALRQIRQSFPGWNDDLISFRLHQTTEQIAALTKQVAAIAKPAPTYTEAQWNALREELVRAITERNQMETNYQAKLKEALAARPRSLDPGELAKADQRIGDLEAELKRYRLTGEEVRKQQRAQQEALLLLSQQNEQFKQQIAALNDKGELTKARAENASLRKQLDELSRQASRLPRLTEVEQELGKVRADLQSGQQRIEMLRKENKKLEDLLIKSP